MSGCCHVCRVSRVLLTSGSPLPSCSFSCGVGEDSVSSVAFACLRTDLLTDRRCIIGEYCRAIPFLASMPFLLLGRCVDLNLLPASDGRPMAMAYVFVRAPKLGGLWTSSGSVPEVKVNCMSLILTDHLRVFSFCGGIIGLWGRIMLAFHTSCAHFLSSHSFAFHRVLR